MTLKRANPSELDLLESAWASIKNDLEPLTLESYRRNGWKTNQELSRENGVPLRTLETRLKKLIIAGKLEQIQIAVSSNGGPRRLTNLYRPIAISFDKK